VSRFHSYSVSTKCDRIRTNLNARIHNSVCKFYREFIPGMYLYGSNAQYRRLRYNVEYVPRRRYEIQCSNIVRGRTTTWETARALAKPGGLRNDHVIATAGCLTQCPGLHCTVIITRVRYGNNNINTLWSIRYRVRAVVVLRRVDAGT
jgi:hypothetical protein